VLKVGLTGGIGSGKSTVASVFALLGVPVYFADQRAQYLIQNDTTVRAAIIDLLGTDAYSADGTLHRKMVADRVFGDATLLLKLNGIVHPAVRQDFAGWCQERSEEPYVIQEAAILIESGGASIMDALILVWAPEQVRVDRVVGRDGSTEEEVRVRIEHQMKDLDKVNQSNYVIINDGAHSILTQVREIHAAICYKS
jgi:dephospho-CoA kinase